MAFEAVCSSRPHGRELHCREMAPQAVAVCNVPVLRRQDHDVGIGFQGFVVEVVETGLDFEGKLSGDIRIGKMAFDADKLFVGGFLPAAVGEVHAVTDTADPRVSGGVVSYEIDGDEGRSGDKPGGQQLDGGKAQQVFPVHARTPLCCDVWVGY